MLRFSRFALLSVLFSSLPLHAQTTFPSVLTSPPVSTPISAPTRIVGPAGLRREVGNWLLNDSIFVSSGENVVAPNTPPFLINLRRDKKAKLPLFRPAATRGPLNFATLPLPSLREMLAPNFNFAALQSSLTTQIAAARAAGRLYVGFSMAVGGAADAAKTPWTPEQMADFKKRLRAALDVVAPEAALILDVDATSNPSLAVSDLSAAAPFCDAVVLRVDINDENQLWPLKMARRVVEEQPDYDLPVFVAPTAPADKTSNDSNLLEFLMGGATGFILPAEQTPSWAGLVARNAGLFAGAVTLEDAAVLPSPNPLTSQIVEDLRALGRVPLVGRLPKAGGNGESLLAVLDAQTSLETLDGLDKAARSGATIFLEGVPDLGQKPIATKFSDMTSCILETLAAPKLEVLTLDDIWLFGDARGQELNVTQRVKWTPKTSLADQTRIKKGDPSPLPFSSARLAGDANGLLNAPLGKGRLLWLPHLPTTSASNDAPRLALMSAIAGNLQASLARWKWDSPEAQIHSGGLRVALRASPAQTTMVAIFNSSNSDAMISLSTRSNSPVALDLATGKDVATTVVDYSATLPITVPAHGWRLIAFGEKRAALDKERLAPRPTAKIR